MHTSPSDSDSVSPGSNPGPPATLFPEHIQILAAMLALRDGQWRCDLDIPLDTDALSRLRPSKGQPVPFGRVLPVSTQEAHAFWWRIKSRPDGACWPWPGATNAKGYGRVRIGGRLESPHRVAFSIAKGDELVTTTRRIVLHSCDNPGCCNPAHLRLGTHHDNNQDMLARGRQRKPSPSLRSSTLIAGGRV